MKLNQGMHLDNFIFNTPFENGLSIEEFVSRVPRKTALVFLRYYGCTLCQYDIHIMAKGYASVTQAGGQIAIVLQSSAQVIANQMNKDDLPFNIICDPEQLLYKKYEIAAAKSMAALSDIKAVGKMAKATVAGYRHGEYEGEELQLPAIFVVNKDLIVEYIHYAKTVSDMPSIDRIAALVK